MSNKKFNDPLFIILFTQLKHIALTLQLDCVIFDGKKKT